jgi:hypothetical protein
MPNAVLLASTHCAIAQRTPRNPTTRGKRLLRGALLREDQCVGWAPRLRCITRHTVRSGRPSRHRVPRRLVNSYSSGPLVPSDPVRRYQQASGRLLAIAATEGGVRSLAAPCRLVRPAPRERYGVVSMTGPSSQARVSAGLATQETRSTERSTASRNAALLP